MGAAINSSRFLSAPRGRRSAICALTTISVLAAGTSAAIAEPNAPAGPTLRLMVASGKVTIERFEGDSGLYLDLGTYLSADGAPFEVRAKRTSYRDPITAAQIIRRGNKVETRALPKGLVKDFSGFDRFLHITLTNAAGKKVVDRYDTACPNGQGNRIRPDAPDKTPYPMGCSSNPFTLGSVWGIQKGWATSTFSWSSYVEDPNVGKLPDGTYTAKIGITKPYQDLFGASGEQKTVQVTIKTRTQEEGAEAARAAREAAARAQSAGKAPKAAAARPTGKPKVPNGPKPDLRSLPAWGIEINDGSDGEGHAAQAHAAHADHAAHASGAAPGAQAAAAPPKRDYLAFAANVWNAGPSPLVVDGFRRTGKDLMDAYQYFYDGKGKQVGYAPTGTMEWDARDGHTHWHFTDFAVYRLLNADKKSVVRSQKEAFCLANTDAIDYLVKNANWRPYNTDLHTACGEETSVSVREVLDVGSGDTYAQFRPGQSFDVTTLPNGTYYIQVVANPQRRLYESNLKNNVSLRKVVLSGKKGARKVTVPPVGLIDAP